MILVSSIVGGAIAGFIGRYMYGSYKWKKQQQEAFLVLSNQKD